MAKVPVPEVKVPVPEDRLNALWNCKNPHQGSAIKVLCVCSAGLLRSPTIAAVLSKLGYNTRAAGVHDYALIRVDPVLIAWADMIVCAGVEHEEIIKNTFYNAGDLAGKPIIALDIPDRFGFMAPELVEEIEDKMDWIVECQKRIA